MEDAKAQQSFLALWGKFPRFLFLGIELPVCLSLPCLTASLPTPSPQMWDLHFVPIRKLKLLAGSESHIPVGGNIGPVKILLKCKFGSP